MIIHQPETKKENGQFIVSSRIEYFGDNDMPNELCFGVDEEHASLVSSRSDIFLSTLVRVARAMGEDIEVRGELSPQLLFGMREYLKVHAAWSGNYDIININASNLVPAKRTSNTSAASCNISGGIDSFHTLWSQLPENEPVRELQVIYGIYGIGFSSPYQNSFLKTTYVPRLKKMLKSLDVNLLVVESNAREFAHPDAWLPISTSRIAVPQLFSGLISTHFVPSSNTYQILYPYGTHPLTDQLFSLESLRIFTHGSEFARFEKLREMSTWVPFYDYLQVCNNLTGNFTNDSVCMKCDHTKLMLKVLELDEKVSTFHRPFRPKSLVSRIIRDKDQYSQFTLIAKEARARGQEYLIPFIWLSKLIYRLTSWIKPLLGYKFK
ncbi:MAG: hypothetical protein N2C13_00100 [Chloroflexota bacterium]